MAKRKYVLYGDQRRAAYLLPFAYRLADSLQAQGRRHARREFMDLSWVEVTIYRNGMQDIRISGGTGYAAGSYLVVEADYVRDGAETIWGAPLTTQPAYRNYFVYAIDGYTGRQNMLFWFYGGSSIASGAVGSRAANYPPPIIYPYFFNNQNEGSTWLMHLHVDNHPANTTGLIYAEYLFVSETRNFGSYTATVEGWQPWFGSGEDTWPQTVYDGTLVDHTFEPPACRMANNTIRGDEAFLWSFNHKTQTSDDPDWTPLVGYRIANASYFGYNTNFWNTWVDFNNAAHFPYPIFLYAKGGNPAVAGWDIYKRSSDPIIRALDDRPMTHIQFFNWREQKLFFATDYFTDQEEPTDVGLFSIDIASTPVATLERTLTQGVYEPPGGAFFVECFLQSDESNVVGFALSLNDDIAEAGYRCDFYVGTTLGTATKLFSINALTDLINEYDPTDDDLKAEHPGELTYFWHAEMFCLLDATPGARVFGFAMTNTNAYLGYPNIIGRYDEATNDIKILQKSNLPYTSNATWWHSRMADAQANEANNGNSVMYLEWSYDQYPTGKYMKPPVIIQWDTGENLDIGMKPITYPVSSGYGTGNWRLAYKWPGIHLFQSSAHSLPITP